MHLLPTHCDSCGQSALVPEQAILEGSARCRECGAPARTLPGESYTAPDVLLFEQLETTLRDSGITSLEAQHLAAELDARDRELPGSGLARLIEELPSLTVLDVMIPREPVTLRKAEGMLATLLKAHASRRSQSGFVIAETRDKRSTSG